MTNSNRLTFGCELEWSDTDRRVDIPESVGSWEGPKIAGYYMGSEIDIVNTKGKWKGHGTDPLCLDCPVGGEIHTQPSSTIESQMYRIMDIMNRFSTVAVACPNHGHIHVGIAGIKDDLQAIKNLFAYTKANEADLITACCGYSEAEAQEVRNSGLGTWVQDYLLVGDGKSISPDLYGLVERADTVSEVLNALERVSCDDWFWDTDMRVPTVGSHRTAFNLFNLTKGETVEFRIFRASVNPVEIYSTLYFAKRYVEEALKGADGKPVAEILTEGEFKFPKLNFDEDLALGWQNTRSTKGRCGCFKHYTGTVSPSEYKLENSAFDQGMELILNLVKTDFNRGTIDNFYRV